MATVTFEQLLSRLEQMNTADRLKVHQKCLRCGPSSLIHPYGICERHAKQAQGESGEFWDDGDVGLMGLGGAWVGRGW